MVFDVLAVHGVDLCRRLWAERRRLLHKLLDQAVERAGRPAGSAGS
jgi:ATP-dependent DNA ligase